MAGAIKKTEIVEADLGLLADEIHKVGEEISRLWDILGKKPKIEGLGDIVKINKETVQAAKDIATQKKAILDIESKVVSLIEKEAKAREAESKAAIKSAQEKTQAILNEEKAIQAKIKTDKDLLALEKQQKQSSEQKIKLSTQETQILKLQEIANKSLAGSFDQLNAKYKLNIIELQGMSEAQRNTTQRSKDLIAENAILIGKLNHLDKQSGKTGRSFNGLQWQVTQLAREVPSMAYGMNVFFGAIGNNLPMLIDEIKAVSAANKIAAAEGRATIPVWKQVAGSILNWQTAIILALTFLTLYGRELSKWTKELFKGRDAVNSLSEAMKKNVEGSREIGEEMAKEKTSMKLNYLVAKDVTRSYEERLAAAGKLISKYPDILGNFTSEQLLASGLSDTYAQLTEAIEKSFEARFAETKILENYREMAKQQKIIDEGGTMWGKFSRLTVKYTKDLDGAKNKIEEIKVENKKLFEQFNVVGEDKFGIKAASKEFEIYSKLQSKETKKVFDERSGFVSKDAQTYKQWLTNQLVVYKDNIDAKMALEQELATFIKKDKKPKDKKPKETKDFKYDLQGEEEMAQRELNALLLKADKELNKELNDERKQRTQDTISDSVALADEEKLSAQEVAIEKIKSAKNSKDEIEKIQHELTLFMIDEDIKAQQRILDTAFLEPNAYEAASKRMRQLMLQRGEEEIQHTEKTEEQKKQIRNETMQATNELLQQGLSFAQSIYSAQATRAEEAYNTEMAAAGDSLEYQTLAKRKFEAEDKKIKQRQAITAKLQAVLEAGLALALAIATTWKNPLLAALNIGAATIGLGMALATPIPQFAEGEESTPDTFIAGDAPKGSSKKGAIELIKLKSGKKILTPSQPTLFSGSEFLGSTVFPNAHAETQKMLANMAFNQVREVVDLSKTNSHLASMDKQMKNKIERYTDSKGRTVVKRGTVNSTI
jgi:hypothetical protein